MNLRLSDAVARLAALAEAEGVSMHEAVLGAVRRNADGLAHPFASGPRPEEMLAGLVRVTEPPS
jgi:hypothetical protein